MVLEQAKGFIREICSSTIMLFVNVEGCVLRGCMEQYVESIAVHGALVVLFLNL